ncbi:lipase [Kribbella antibiotica]|uniref:Lipase n=1 Tax=Kribbella antibiotica TaxID=190195 RepID=A0A4R4YSE1_9ACTN|nr:lipase [Kribbella antibiotica]TDD47580.1 lipase [Kribbella antibiotica]
MLTRRLLLTATLLAPAARTAQALGLGGGAVELPAPWAGGSAAVTRAAGARHLRKAVQLRFPRPTGRFPVGTTELHLVDHRRRDPWVAGRVRELMVSVWYPAGSGGERAAYLPQGTAEVYGEGAAVALQQPVGSVDWAGARTHAGLLAPVRRGRFPVVVFSPGFGVPRGLATVMVTELASRGYVVVTVDHTFEAAAVEFPGGRLEVQTLPDDGYALTARATRAADVRFVLDELTKLAAGTNPDAEQRRLPDGLGQILDLRHIGAFGHSAGGITAADVMDVDRRVHAGIDLDGTLAYGYSDPSQCPAVAHGTDRPFLLFGTGGTGPNGGPQNHHTEPSWRMFWANSTGWHRDLNLPNGRHYSFIDHQALIPWFQRFFPVPPELIANTIGSADPEAVLLALRTYIPAFFDQHLRQRPQYGVWSHPLPETTNIR